MSKLFINFIMQNNFFSIFTLTPWDGLKSKQLTEVKLLSIKNILEKYPVIERVFLEDLLSKVYNHQHYSWKKTIRRIIGPKNHDYDITSFNFIWAFDKKNRMYQFLIQKENESEKSQAILVALAPPELGRLLSEFKKEALHRILSLLNNPSAIKFLMILAPKGKSIVQEQKLLRIDENYSDTLNYVNVLKNMPNIQGQWFPPIKERCPKCKGLMTDFQDFNTGMRNIICTKCGHRKK